MWSVFFVLLSYLDRNFVKGEFPSHSLGSEKESKEAFDMLNNTFCAKRSSVGEYHLHQVSDGVEEVRSVHDPTGKLVDCSVTVNQMQVKSFMHVCRLGLKDQRAKPGGLELSFTNVGEAKSNCREFRSRATTAITPKERKINTASANDNHVLRRSKRGFTYPGTLWCGAGNIADHYDQLGEFAETDKCCRVHDHCPDVIHAFSSKYGFTNFKWHSISHCDCDNALKECLRIVNDTSSRVVGQAFFNVMEVPCFEFSFEEQCMERHWYGVCKRYGKVPVAVPRESIPYDFGGITVIDKLPLSSSGEKVSDDAGKEEDAHEGTTQSTVSRSQTTAREEPSLGNVVTAAEDFIKVLATVSTSQSSSTDTTKGETQSSEKKRKKNAGKKRKNTKKRGKGKGRKRKEKIDSVSKTGEGAAGSPACHRAADVISKNNFVEEPGKIDQPRRHLDNFMNSALDLRGKDELSDDMMRDEPQRIDDSPATTATSPAIDKESEMLETRKQKDHTETALFPTTVHTPTDAPRETKSLRARKRDGRKKQRRVTPTVPSVGVTEPDAATATTAGRPDSSAAEREPSRGLERLSEKEAVPVTASGPVANPPQIKRSRSKEKEGRKRIGAAVTPPPLGKLAAVTAAAPSSAGRLEHRDDERSVTSVASTPVATAAKSKRRGLQETGGRKKARKAAPTLSISAADQTDHETTTDTDTGAPASPQVGVNAPDEPRSQMAEISAQHAALSAKTSTPATMPLKSKRRKSKERHGGEKIRKINPTL